MVQVQSILKVADNSGAINVQCIRILEKSRAVTASVGDLITVSVKKVLATPSVEVSISLFLVFSFSFLEQKKQANNNFGSKL